MRKGEKRKAAVIVKKEHEVDQCQLKKRRDM